MQKIPCLAMLCVLVGCSAISVRAEINGCPKALEMEALDVAGGTIPDWRAMHEAFDKYRNCDDGAIGEGFSDAVVRLLANKWQDLEILGALTNTDGNFEEFVIKHINETAAERDLRSVHANSKACSGPYKALCEKIHNRANDALSSM